MPGFVLRSTVILMPLLLALPAAAVTNGQLDGTSHPAIGLVAQTLGADACNPDARLTGCPGVLLAPDVFLVNGLCAEGLDFNVQNGFADRTWLILDQDPVDRGAVSNPWLDCTKFIPVSSIHLGSPDDIGVLLLGAPQSQLTPAALPAEGKVRSVPRKPSGLTVVAYGDAGDPTDTETDPATFYRRSATARIGALTARTHDATLEPVGGIQPCMESLSGNGVAFVTGTDTVISVAGFGPGCRSTATFQRLDTSSVRLFLSGFMTLP